MQNPMLAKKNSESLASLTIDPRAQKLFQVIYKNQNIQETEDDSPKIKVSSLISRMAFYYEKLRNTVEYKEEYLLRKNAIERILKREIIIGGAFQQVRSEEVAKRLMVELIRAAYLPNNKIPESKIAEVSEVIFKFLALRSMSLGRLPRNIELRQDFSGWFISMAACEIEELLGRDEVNQAMMAYMSEIMNSNIDFPAGSPHIDDKEIQIFLSIHRNFFKFDQDMLSFILLKYYVGGWKSAGREKLEEVSKNIGSLHEAIQAQLEHPMSKQIDRIAKRYTVIFTMLKDVISEDPVHAYNSIKRDPRSFPRSIKRICEKHYKATSAKLWGAAIRSILYVFLTKSIIVFILEIPAMKFFGETVNIFSLIINVGFPPFLLLLIVLFTPVPSEANSAKIIEGIEQIVFTEKKRSEPYKLKEPGRPYRRFNTFFGLMYALTFTVSFGAVVWILREINFSYISIALFLFFLTLISFFSIRIRRRVKELAVIEPRETIFSFLSNFFYTPILEVGKWISERFSKINVFIFVLDFIIETPFKIFVEITEEWSKYVRERREEI